MTARDREVRGRHTPGPWKAGHYSSVVGLPVSAQPDPKHNTVIICGVRGDRETAEANARLIAAAPTLAEALQQYRDAFRNEGKTSSLHEWNERLKTADRRAAEALAAAGLRIVEEERG